MNGNDNPYSGGRKIFRSNPIHGSEIAPRDYSMVLTDYGPEPLIINIERAAADNTNFRMALWTGEYFQVTLMSILPGESIGLEIHTDTDQFLCVEDGHGIAEMGYAAEALNYQRKIHKNTAIVVPSGIWHNITNTGNIPLKIFSIYAPPHHPWGTLQETKEDAEREEGAY